MECNNWIRIILMSLYLCYLVISQLILELCYLFNLLVLIVIISDSKSDSNFSAVLDLHFLERLTDQEDKFA